MASQFRSVDLMGDNYCIDVLGILKPAKVRGKDSIAPGQEGRYARNRQRDTWIVTLDGWVKGVGSTKEERQQSFFQTMETIMTALDATAPGNLVLDGPDYGLPSGETRTISARPLNIVLGKMESSWTFQKFSADLEAVQDWDIAGS